MMKNRTMIFILLFTFSTMAVSDDLQIDFDGLPDTGGLIDAGHLTAHCYFHDVFYEFHFDFVGADSHCRLLSEDEAHGLINSFVLNEPYPTIHVHSEECYAKVHIY